MIQNPKYLIFYFTTSYHTRELDPHGRRMDLTGWYYTNDANHTAQAEGHRHMSFRRLDYSKDAKEENGIGSTTQRWDGLVQLAKERDHAEEDC